MNKLADKIWMDGAFVEWENATTHVLSHALHYGAGVFEGIRCYNTEDGPAVFRLTEHVDRLFDSAKICRMAIPYTREQVAEAILETVRVNGLKECYIRPLAFIGLGAMGLYPKNNPINLIIAAWPWGAYLGDDGLNKGIKVRVSSFTRHHINAAMSRAKVSGYYMNSILAKQEAISCGCDEALLLDAQGYVAEGSGENIFIVRKGRLITPPLTSILDGITRETVITLAEDRGMKVHEQLVTRDDVYTSSEAFFTGTAAEITPIRELDNREIGPPGPVTKQIQTLYFDVVKGKNPAYKSWLAYV
ncbi:MAG: branched-chain amino acid transaminase [Nitrospirae bacterium]|nr:branched-chain amino acid transaminase [Nitrospirota bacterium]